MKKTTTLLFVFVFITLFTYAQNVGVGFRFGDPMGLTAKVYSGNKSFELNIGRTFFWGRELYYSSDYFYKKFDYDKNYYIFQKTEYSTAAPLCLQLHYLPFKEIEKVPGLSFYYGLGLQVRLARINYYYTEKVNVPPGNSFVYESRVTTLSHVDFGMDGLVGLEYKLKDIPLSFFVDLNAMMEVWDNPFLFWGQGGAGARYNF
jgi:hypothetical protein